MNSRVEECCEIMHDAYERAALGAGWETNQASRKPWADVPEANKVTMRAAVGALLAHLAAGDPPTEPAAELELGPDAPSSVVPAAGEGTTP